MKRIKAYVMAGFIIVAILAVIVVPAVWDALAWRNEVRDRKGWLQIGLYHCFKPAFDGKEENGDLTSRVRVLKEALLAEYPKLRVDLHPVPDEHNGFLQLWQLGKKAGESDVPSEMKRISEELNACLDPWDAGRLREFLTREAGFVAEVERISTLETRSSANMPEDFYGYVLARPASCSVKLKVAQARLSSEAGDEAGALEAMRRAGVLNAHLSGVETPSFITETVVVLNQLHRLKVMVEDLLPRLGSKADLEAWRRVVAEPNFNSTRLAMVCRGEWNTSADDLFLPLALRAHEDGELPDPVATTKAFANRYSNAIEQLETLHATDDGVSFAVHWNKPPDCLSRQGREWVLTENDSNDWFKGHERAASVAALYRAIMELLLLERSGGVLGGGDVAGIAADPRSGHPFVFDPKARTLGLKEGENPHGIKPVKLPW
jgi:hypothetical protein